MGIFTSNDDIDEKVNDKYIDGISEQNDRFGLWMGNQIGSLFNGSFDEKSDNSFGPRWIQNKLANSPIDLMGSGWFNNGFQLPRNDLLEDQFMKEGKTGLYNYKLPSEVQFAECDDVQGLSVWDTNGWWRCLFPTDVIKKRLPRMDDETISKVLTKEKVEADYNHHLGLFFTDYSKYLLWKVAINRKINEQNKKQSEILDVPLAAADSKTPEDLMMSNGNGNDKNIIGTSEYVTYNSSEEGRTKIKESKTFYDNGTTLIRSERKITPNDGSAPRVEHSEHLVKTSESDVGGPPSSTSWFWK